MAIFKVEKRHFSGKKSGAEKNGTKTQRWRLSWKIFTQEHLSLSYFASRELITIFANERDLLDLFRADVNVTFGFYFFICIFINIPHIEFYFFHSSLKIRLNFILSELF